MLWERLRQINSPEAVPPNGGQEPTAERALWVFSEPFMELYPFSSKAIIPYLEEM